jgi:hypothetical protein
MLLATLLLFSYIFLPWKLNSMFLLYCRPTCFCQQYKLLPWKQQYVLFSVVIEQKTFCNASLTIVTAGNYKSDLSMNVSCRILLFTFNRICILSARVSKKVTSIKFHGHGSSGNRVDTWRADGRTDRCDEANRRFWLLVWTRSGFVCFWLLAFNVGVTFLKIAKYSEATGNGELIKIPTSLTDVDPASCERKQRESEFAHRLSNPWSLKCVGVKAKQLWWGSVKHGLVVGVRSVFVERNE